MEVLDATARYPFSSALRTAPSTDARAAALEALRVACGAHTLALGSRAEAQQAGWQVPVSEDTVLFGCGPCDVHRLAQLVPVARLIVEGARRDEETLRLARRLEQSRELAALVSHLLDPHDHLTIEHLATTALARILSVDACALLVVGERGQWELRLPQRQFTERGLGEVEGSPLEALLKNECSAFEFRMSSWPTPVTERLEALGFERAAAFPLRTGTEGPAMGVLLALWTGGRSLDDEARQTANQAATMIALALERLAAQQALQARTEEALEASRVKSQFLATMSHEIRTPLNGILGLTRLVLETAAPEAQADLLTVHASAQHLLAVVNDILDLAKVESGRLQLVTEPWTVREVLTQATRGQQVSAQARGLALTVDVDPAVPEVLLGDAMRVTQVLTNLVANAVKFTERGAVQVRVDATDDEVLVKVHDTGIGIAPSQLEAVFEAFRQADGGHDRRFGGTGLGLTISRYLARHMGGDLTVHSTLGQGSTFTFRFPLRVARQSTPSSATLRLTPLPSEAPLRVLLAEDNPVNARVAMRLLERLGHEAVHVTNGALAVAALEALPFDVVLMDLQMPEMDGLAATQAIRAREKTRGGHVSIIALTANAMQGDEALCRDAGMDDYLAKPIHFEHFEAKLQAVRALTRVMTHR